MVLFLFGPTGVGKTRLLQSLGGRSVDVEVISADSMQVYRGMDIGTAKPSVAFRARIPHHLIDIRNPDEQYDVGGFVEDANVIMDHILDRGRLPIVSGGTGYYFKHLLFGLPETPPSDPAVRERVRERSRRLGLERLYEELRRVDPVTAGRVDPNDGYRVTRALEVYEQTARPLSSFAMTGTPRNDVEVTSVSLQRERDELRARIAERVGGMFAAGLRGEVERLLASGYGPGDPGLRAIGYREFFDAEGEFRPATDDDEIAGEIAKNTRRYAKRQQLFFRQLPDVLRVPADETGRVVGLVDRLCAELDSP